MPVYKGQVHSEGCPAHVKRQAKAIMRSGGSEDVAYGTAWKWIKKHGYAKGGRKKKK